MKPFKINKWVAVGLALIVTALLFIVGKAEHADDVIKIAPIAAVALTEEEKQGFDENEQKFLLACKKMAASMKEDVSKGLLTKEEIKGLITETKISLKGESEAAKTLSEQLFDLKETARKQGVSIQEMMLKAEGFGSNKSLSEVLSENKESIEKIYKQNSGTVQFMLTYNTKGEMVAKPFDPVKAAGPHASITDVGGAGNVSSIASSINAATILRMAGDAPVQSQYRNTPWLFDLCNLQTVGFNMPFAVWYEEQAKQGASATVAEGATKPLSQYIYTLRSSEYKKEATLLGFTQEFQLDFERLQSDATGKGKTDLINRINSAILTNLLAAATAYNTSASFGTRPAANINDWVALAALSAQVDNATFGANANVAIMSTFKKYNLGTLQTSQMEWIDIPSVLQNLNLTGNPGMGADDIVVGDLKQYNILLRGGLILKIGYNGTDFAENRFSQVLEQYYFDYIPELRKPAIVKGQTFAAVKTAITTV